LAEPGNLEEIYAKGKILRARYEPPGEQAGRISQYLQHITEKRIDAKDWEVSTMISEIEPLLSEVEKHLGVHTFIFAPVPVKTLDYFSASTAVGTTTAVTPRNIGEATLTKPKDFE